MPRVRDFYGSDVAGLLLRLDSASEGQRSDLQEAASGLVKGKGFANGSK